MVNEENVLRITIYHNRLSKFRKSRFGSIIYPQIRSGAILGLVFHPHLLNRDEDRLPPSDILSRECCRLSTFWLRGDSLDSIGNDSAFFEMRSFNTM